MRNRVRPYIAVILAVFLSTACSVFDWHLKMLGLDGVNARISDTLAVDGEVFALATHEGNLYALALDRYLALKLAGYDYETHFGAIYYIFLRGVDPEQDPSLGVYRDRPDARLIRALRTNLIDDA